MFPRRCYRTPNAASLSIVDARTYHLLRARWMKRGKEAQFIMSRERERMFDALARQGSYAAISLVIDIVRLRGERRCSVRILHRLTLIPRRDAASVM